MCNTNSCVVISKAISCMLLVVEYYLKEPCNTIIKFKGSFPCYRCFIIPHSHFNGIAIVCVVTHRLNMFMHAVRI